MPKDLLDLSPELRVCIFEHVYQNDRRSIHLHKKDRLVPLHPLLQLCRLLAEEALPIGVSTRTINLNNYDLHELSKLNTTDERDAFARGTLSLWTHLRTDCLRCDPTLDFRFNAPRRTRRSKELAINLGLSVLMDLPRLQSLRVLVKRFRQDGCDIPLKYVEGIQQHVCDTLVGHAKLCLVELLVGGGDHLNGRESYYRYSRALVKENGEWMNEINDDGIVEVESEGGEKEDREENQAEEGEE